jgi:hypothetical protein
MNEEKQRIKIAEAVGWKKLKDFSDSGWPLLLTPPEKPNKKWYLEAIPDYLNDLNAMHKALKLIGEIKGIDLCWHLNDMGISGEWQILNATAEELAEAFLKTLNLWEE